MEIELMGVSLPTAKVLMELGAKEGFTGRVLQLGRQSIVFSKTELKEAAQRIGFPLARVDPVQEAFTDIAFFGSWGFDRVDSLDVSDCEGASKLFDLNSTYVAETYQDCFDVVFDGGTVEQVFRVQKR